MTNGTSPQDRETVRPHDSQEIIERSRRATPAIMDALFEASKPIIAAMQLPPPSKRIMRSRSGTESGEG